MMQLVGSLCKRHAVVPCETPTACKRTVSGSISLPCSGCFPPFPHGTGPLSVFRKYLALRDGPRRFRQDSSCPALLRIPVVLLLDSNTGLSPAAARLSRRFFSRTTSHGPVLLPRLRRNEDGLGSFPFDRHYSGNRSFFLFLQVLRCFSSLRSLISRCIRPSAVWVDPFGHPRIKSPLQIPADFRSFARPSSLMEAKASSVCS